MDSLTAVRESSVELAEKRNKLERYTKFIKLDPNNENLFLDALALALELGELKIASELIDTTDSLLKQSGVFHAHAGYLFLAQGDYAVALEYFSQAVASGITDAVIIYNMASCYFYCRDYQTALDMLNSISQTEQPYPSGHMLLKARLLHHLDDITGAIQQLQELLQTHGFHAEAAGLLSLIMFEAGEDISITLGLADKALHDNPLLIEPLIARISLNLETGNYVQAESDALTATLHHPEVGRAWASLAQVYFNNLQFDLSKSASEKAVHYMANHIGTWHLLGWAHIMLADFESALKVFKDSYELDHRFAETHGGLAAAYAHLKQDHLAEKHIKLAQKLNPEGFAAIYAQMVLLNNDNNSKAAQDLFEQSIHKSNTQIGTTPKSLIDRRLFELSGNISNKQSVH